MNKYILLGPHFLSGHCRRTCGLVEPGRFSLHHLTLFTTASHVHSDLFTVAGYCVCSFPALFSIILPAALASIRYRLRFTLRILGCSLLHLPRVFCHYTFSSRDIHWATGIPVHGTFISAVFISLSSRYTTGCTLEWTPAFCYRTVFYLSQVRCTFRYRLLSFDRAICFAAPLVLQTFYYRAFISHLHPRHLHFRFFTPVHFHLSFRYEHHFLLSAHTR